MIPFVPRKPMKGRSHRKSDHPSTPSHIDPVNALLGKQETAECNDAWRRYGIEKRRQLIEQDTAEGGNHFELNFQCRISGYFALAEKITAKFDASFAKGDDLEATYVMGHRLCHFLIEALPRHPSYTRRDLVISRLREKSFRSIVRIKKQIDALSLRIDEEELNKYILHDFDPFADDDDNSCSSSSSDVDQVSSLGVVGPRTDNIQWESFDGWSFDLPAKMAQSADFVAGGSIPMDKELDDTADTDDTFSSSEVSLQDSDDQVPIYDARGWEFLKQISREEVTFETDSEAADSWAQECESDLEFELDSSPSSGDSSYDPARLALKELILNKRLLRQCAALERTKNLAVNAQRMNHGKENQSVDFGLSPDSSLNREDEDIWIAFDPTATLPDETAESLERVSL